MFIIDELIELELNELYSQLDKLSIRELQNTVCVALEEIERLRKLQQHKQKVDDGRV